MHLANEESSVSFVDVAKDGRLRGLAIANAFEEMNAARVAFIGVKKKHRREGVGTHLLKGVERALYQKGIGNINLNAPCGLKETFEFYRTNGYEEIPLSNNDEYEKGGCLVHFYKSL